MRAFLFAMLGLGVMGCSAGKGESEPVGFTSDGGPDSGFNLNDGGTDPDGFTVTPGTDSGPGTCAAKSFAAEPSIAPVDIIWVVDSSGSMDNEAKRVQDNLNAFSADIGKVGIDYHVVMITSSSFVKVPPPLGTSPKYLFIDRAVNSHEPLQALLDDFSKYSSFLRPLAVTHFVGVTDDESSIKAEDFYAQMVAKTKLGHGFTFHAIASEKVAPTFTNPEGACQTSGFPPEGAAAPGIQYYKLADATKGLKFSICTSDWSGLFKTLTAAVAVAAKLPCVFSLPKPDSGEIDPTKVNVQYTKGSGGSPETLVYVGSKDGCMGGPGWYYDDPAKPTMAILCDATCTTVSADKAGKIDVALGCATKIK
jgi:hypothetical protein